MACYAVGPIRGPAALRLAFETETGKLRRACLGTMTITTALPAKCRMVKKSIGINFQKNKNVFITATLIVGRDEQ